MSKRTPALVLVVTALTLTACGPKKDNAAVAALKNEKNAWERESNSVANEATEAVDTARKEVAKEADEVQ